MSNSTLQYNPTTGDFERVGESSYNYLNTRLMFDDIEFGDSFNENKQLLLNKKFTVDSYDNFYGIFDDFGRVLLKFKKDPETNNVISINLKLENARPENTWTLIKNKYDSKYGRGIDISPLKLDDSIRSFIRFKYNTSKGVIVLSKKVRLRAHDGMCIIDVGFSNKNCLENIIPTDIPKADFTKTAKTKYIIPDNYIWVKLAGKNYLLDVLTKEIQESVGPYDEVKEKEDWVETKNEGKIGLVLTENGIHTIPCEYCDITKKNNLYFARKSLTSVRTDIYDGELNKIVEDIISYTIIDKDVFTAQFANQKYLFALKHSKVFCLTDNGMVAINGFATFSTMPKEVINIQTYTQTRPFIYNITSIYGTKYILFTKNMSAVKQTGDDILFLDETYQCYSENHLIGLMKDGQKISKARYSAITFPKANFIFAFTPYGGLNGNTFFSCEIVDLKNVDCVSGYNVVYHGLTEMDIYAKNGKGYFKLLSEHETISNMKELRFCGYDDPDVAESFYRIIGAITNEDARNIRNDENKKVQLINYDYMKSLNLISE